jgi:sulfate adenylyltransferase large subunit
MSGLLRICTAGSVDDGKSTLIGRLLYDSRSVYEDQVRSVRAASRNRTAGPIDFSLFTDGLRAEREQGITIDVAYRYFATARRTFILADTPGHEQYTRNMATGASTADVAVLLVDARQGIREQTHRHARIARLLGISTFVVAVNKMDLVDFDEDVFAAIEAELPDALHGATVQPIPISALDGDNVIAASDRTPWYDGPALLPFLETAEAARPIERAPFRFPVQLVIRPDHTFRGYAGQIASGRVAIGDEVTAWPSGRTTYVTRIVTWDGDLTEAAAPMSVTLVLGDEIDVSRGDTLGGARSLGAEARSAKAAVQGADPHVGRRFTANVVWMDERPLRPGRPYVLKHGTRTVTASSAAPLALNQIGLVTITTGRPLVFEPYADNRTTGSFIVIDPLSNFTAGAGMIVAAQPEDGASIAPGAAERLAAAARDASSDAAAVDAVRALLEEVLA